MLQKIRRTVCAVLTAGMLLASLAGCSTPEVAITVDGREYKTGEYLAYLYTNYAYLAQSYQMQMYQYTGQLPSMDNFWTMTMPYGEGEDTSKLPQLAMEDYLKQVTKDAIVRQSVIEKMMKDNGIAYAKDEVKQMEDNADSTYSSNDLLQLGISKAHYTEMLKASTLGYNTLLLGLYDKGGKRAMSEEDIRKYFAENFYSYKSIDFTLTDDDGGDLTDEELKKIDNRLAEYRNLYEKNKDFNKTIEKYEADEKAIADAKTSTTTTSGTGTGTATTSAGQTTTSTPTTTTTAATTTASTGSTSAGETATTAAANDEGGDTDPNWKDIDLSTADEGFAAALKGLKVNECKIVEYTANEVKHKALILRLDPEKKEGRETYFEDSRKNILTSANGEALDEEIDKGVEAVKDKIVVNDRTVKMCSPKNFAK